MYYLLALVKGIFLKKERMAKILSYHRPSEKEDTTNLVKKMWVKVTALPRNMIVMIISLLLLVSIMPFLNGMIHDIREYAAGGLSYPPDTTLTSVSNPSVSRPGYLSPIIDPVFNTKITRVSDQQAFGISSNVIRHEYSKNQAWNSDQSLILLTQPYPGALLDGKTYAFLRHVHNPSWGVWSNINPRIMYGTQSGNQLVTHDMIDDTQKAIYTFSGYSNLSIGEGEGNLTDDDHYVALEAQDSSSAYHAIIFDLTTNSVVANKTLPVAPDWVAMDHTGNYVAIQWNSYGSGTNQGVDLYDRSLNFLRKLTYAKSHGDFAWDVNGHEVFVNNSDCTSMAPVTCSTPSNLAAYRLDNGQSFGVLGKNYNGNGEHTSGRNLNRMGWVYVSDFGENNTQWVNYDEVLAVKLDPTISPSNAIVERFGHEHHTYNAGYDAMPMAVPNRDGNKVLFASDWNGGSSAIIYDYIAEWPVTSSTPAPTVGTTPTNTPTPTGVQTSLPAPWKQTDIGSVGAAGNTTVSSGTYTTTVTSGDIWYSQDSFHFTYQPLPGDGAYITKVTSVADTEPYAKAGIMIRQGLTSDTPNVLIALTPENGVTFQYRTTTGGLTTSIFNPPQPESAPYWVKLVKSGSIYTGYKSVDGVNWVQQGSISVSLSGTLYVGLAVSGSNMTTANTSVFNNVNFASSTQPTSTPYPTPTVTQPTPTATIPTPTPVTFDTVSPTVSITYPANGSTIQRNSTLTLSANASDNVGVSSVEFLVNGSLVCTDSSSPYSCGWKVSGKPKATYTITVRAYDAMGNTDSSAIRVTSSR